MTWIFWYEQKIHRWIESILTRESRPAQLRNHRNLTKLRNVFVLVLTLMCVIEVPNVRPIINSELFWKTNENASFENYLFLSWIWFYELFKLSISTVSCNLKSFIERWQIGCDKLNADWLSRNVTFRRGLSLFQTKRKITTKLFIFNSSLSFNQPRWIICKPSINQVHTRYQKSYKLNSFFLLEISQTCISLINSGSSDTWFELSEFRSRIADPYSNTWSQRFKEFPGIHY